jgi:hypothetical protein
VVVPALVLAAELVGRSCVHFLLPVLADHG